MPRSHDNALFASGNVTAFLDETEVIEWRRVPCALILTLNRVKRRETRRSEKERERVRERERGEGGRERERERKRERGREREGERERERMGE